VGAVLLREALSSQYQMVQPTLRRWLAHHRDKGSEVADTGTGGTRCQGIVPPRALHNTNNHTPGRGQCRASPGTQAAARVEKNCLCAAPSRVICHSCTPSTALACLRLRNRSMRAAAPASEPFQCRATHFAVRSSSPTAAMRNDRMMQSRAFVRNPA
jgi:hypothetical protein